MQHRSVDHTLSMTDWELIKELRMNHEEIKEICDLVSGEMQSVGHRLVDLTLKQKVLLCLKTLGSGSFQTTSKGFFEETQPTVSKVMSQFVDAITAKASTITRVANQSDAKSHISFS